MTTTQTLDLSNAALVLVDPQKDLLSPESVVWDVVGERVTRIDLVSKLRRLRDAAEQAGIPVMYAHVGINDSDYDALAPRTGLQSLMKDRRMCVVGRGAGFVDELAPSAGTVVLSARQGPSAFGSDFEQRMHELGRDTAVFAGMIANLCVESHARDAVQMGFHAHVVSDAIGALSDESLSATLENLALHATGTLTTQEFIDAASR